MTNQDDPVENERALTLPSDLEIRFTRVIDAPRERVFAAWTDPEEVRKAAAAAGTTLDVSEIDPRVGGRWRSVIRAPDGSELAFTGVCREFVPLERIVLDERFENRGVEYVETHTFEERGGRTRVTSHWLHRSKMARDRHLAGGAWAGGDPRVRELLATVSP